MAFDISTAKPAGGFDVSTAQAQPVPEVFIPEDPTDSIAPIPIKPDFTFGEKAEGVFETGKALATGLTTGLVGLTGGTIEGVLKEVVAGNFGTREAADRIQALATQRMGEFTNTPESEAGKAFLKATGEALAPLSAIPPLAEFQAIAAASRPPLRLAFKRDSPANIKLAELIEKNADPAQIKSFSVKAFDESAPALKAGVSNKAAKFAARQGLDEGTIDLVRNASAADKGAMRKSMKILKDNMRQTSEGKLGAVTSRPGDAAGDMLFRRLRTVEVMNKKAGKAVGAAAENLKSKTVSLSQVHNNFIQKMEGMGITFSEVRGKLVGRYGDSEFARSLATQKTLDDFANLSNRPRINGLLAHRLKKVIDGSIEKGKKSTEDPILRQGEKLLEDLRKDINDTLSNVSKPYKDANKKFSDTRTKLDEFADITGTKFDSTAPGAGKMLTGKLRSLMSNNANRTPAMNAINGLQEVAKKYGAKFPDDVLKQTAWMTEIEKSFGTSAPMSFAGQIELATGRGVDQAIRSAAQGGITGVVAEGAIAAKNLAIGVNMENLIKSIDGLLSTAR